MRTRRSDDFSVRLRNAHGVPVMQVTGVIGGDSPSKLMCMLARLMGAGHYNVIINLEHATASDWEFLQDLAEAVNDARNHYGSVHLIVSHECADRLRYTRNVANLFRVSRSENQAVSRILGLYRSLQGVSATNARLVDQQ